MVLRELGKCLFKFDPLDMRKVVDAANKEKPGTFPDPLNLQACADSKELSWWHGKVKRVYLAPMVQYSNLVGFYSRYVDGPCGTDQVSHSNVIRDREAFITSFMGVMELAKNGHLTGIASSACGMSYVWLCMCWLPSSLTNCLFLFCRSKSMMAWLSSVVCPVLHVGAVPSSWCSKALPKPA